MSPTNPAASGSSGDDAAGRSATAPNPSTAMARAIVDELARAGVTDAVVAPGSRSAALAFALHDDDRIALHVLIDERSAAFVGLGLARATGRPTVVVTTSGSAVANLHPAVIEADLGEVPLLLLTADRPLELRDTGANQTIDQRDLFGRAVRLAIDIGAPEDRGDAVALWRSTASRAVAEALGRSGRSGPVHLNLGFREPTVPAADDGRSPPADFLHPVTGREDGRAFTRVVRPTTRVDEAAMDVLAERLASDRGVLLVGDPTTSVGGVVAAGEHTLEEAIGRLAAATGWPVLAEPLGRLRAGDHALGRHHLLAHPGFLAAHRPDFAIRIGRTTVSTVVDTAWGPGVPRIAIGVDAGRNDPVRATAEAFVADARATCTALADRLEGRWPAASDWSAAWHAADAAARSAVDRVLDEDDTVSEPRTARDLGAELDADARLVTASSMPIRDLDRYLPAGAAVEIVANRGASGIDGTVSTALGVALADARPTVGLVGDLAMLHDANGLLLAAARPMDAVLVVVDNDGGGIFSFLPQARFPASFERVFATPHGRDLAHLAQFHGIRYEQVERAPALGDVVLDALREGGTHLVHVRTDRTDNLALHRRADEAARRALDRHA
jgi:2-succinyl-5-enolpyruvyl-6-hydroxy-3-cyclohexene-1-carboxylate synthase